MKFFWQFQISGETGRKPAKCALFMGVKQDFRGAPGGNLPSVV
jgi:hypothetical protein